MDPEKGEICGTNRAGRIAKKGVSTTTTAVLVIAEQVNVERKTILGKNQKKGRSKGA